MNKTHSLLKHLLYGKSHFDVPILTRGSIKNRTHIRFLIDILILDSNFHVVTRYDLVIKRIGRERSKHKVSRSKNTAKKYIYVKKYILYIIEENVGPGVFLKIVILYFDTNVKHNT